MKNNVNREDLEKVKRIIIYSKKKSMLMISEMNDDMYNDDSIKLLLNEIYPILSSNFLNVFLFAVTLFAIYVK